MQGKPTLLLIDLDHSCKAVKTRHTATCNAPPSSAQTIQKSAILSYHKFQPRDAEKPVVLR